MRCCLSTLSWLAILAIRDLPLQTFAYALSPNPVVTTPNGPGPKNTPTFIGRSLPQFDQELFLGIKYADEPVRFTPSSLKTAYASNDSDLGLVHHSSIQGTTLYNASQYGYECPGYGSDTTTLLQMGLIQMNEDCLNLNIVRPKKEAGDDHLLPVMVWIFGGGWSQGATADPRYGLDSKTVGRVRL